MRSANVVFVDFRELTPATAARSLLMATALRVGYPVGWVRRTKRGVMYLVPGVDTRPLRVIGSAHVHTS
jgi:hypothetical protein